nr:uncharacterized protein LOC112036356 [Quercus suber]
MGHGLRKSLTGKPATSVRQLMDRIDKYKRVEEDLLQGKGKEKAIPQERRDSRSDRYNNAHPRRDFIGQSGATNAQAVGTVFREPVHRVLEKIKNEPYFRWLSKMSGNPEKRNQDRYCQYHQDHGHATEDCRNLWNYLDQLVRKGRLKHLLHHSSSQHGQTYQEPRRDTAMGQPAGTINVILAAPGRIGIRPSRVLSIAQMTTGESQSKPKRARRGCHPTLTFSEKDKDGTTQPHDNALLTASVAPVDTAAEEARLEGLKKVVIDDDQERFFQVGTQLPPREKEELLEFLKSNLDVFAWDPCDAPGIEPFFICHRLNVNPSVILRKQPPRCPSKEHAEAVKEEVNKLKRERY